MNWKLIMSNVYIMIGKEGVVAYLNSLFQYLFREAEESHQKLHSEFPIIRLRCEPRTSRIRIKSLVHL